MTYHATSGSGTTVEIQMFHGIYLCEDKKKKKKEKTIDFKRSNSAREGIEKSTKSLGKVHDTK